MAQPVRIRPFAPAVLLAMLALAFAGCVTPEPDIEPATRITSLTSLSFGGTFCPFASSPDPFAWCVASGTRFADFSCDPHQAALASWAKYHLARNASAEGFVEDPHPPKAVEGGGAFVDCEYSFTWEATGRSLLPDATFTATATHAGQNETVSCRIGPSGDCSLSGRIRGAFNFTGPDQEVELRATLTGRLSAFGGQPVTVPEGQGSWELEWRLGT